MLRCNFAYSGRSLLGTVTSDPMQLGFFIPVVDRAEFTQGLGYLDLPATFLPLAYCSTTLASCRGSSAISFLLDQLADKESDRRA